MGDPRFLLVAHAEWTKKQCYRIVNPYLELDELAQMQLPHQPHLEAAPSLYVALLGVAAPQVVQLKSKPGGAFQFEFSLQTY